jgi:hypothetical protein
MSDELLTANDMRWHSGACLLEDDRTAAGLRLETVLDAIRAFVRRYLHISDNEANLITLWIALTHTIDAFDYAAYLHITSVLPECGKSRVLDVLDTLVVNPWKTARVTAAVLMRKMDAEHPTLLLDESDAAFNGNEEYSEALRGMLNDGFKRDGRSSVCVGQGANLTYKDFSVFGPKAIAGIGRLPSTVESRSIPIVMKRRTKTEPLDKWRDRDGREAATVLREQLAASLAPAIDGLKVARPVMPEGLSDRAEDVLEPLLAIADLAGGDWPAAARAAALALMSQAARANREADQHLPLELLTDIARVFEEAGNPSAMFTKVIVEKLVGLEDRPWATFGRSEKPITGHRIARLLKGYGIEPAGQIWIGSTTGRGYRLAAFTEALTRYAGIKALERYNANNDGPGSPIFKALEPERLTLSKTPIHSDKHWGTNALTLSNPDHEQEPHSELNSTRLIDEPEPDLALTDEPERTLRHEPELPEPPPQAWPPPRHTPTAPEPARREDLDRRTREANDRFRQGW